MKRLCTICARGGSKGVKGKNIRLLSGKPLIAYTIEQAKTSSMFDAIAVSSDSDEILETAGRYGIDYCIKRPDELAKDTSGKLPAILHCVKEVERLSGEFFDTFVDLDATAPLRIPNDIINSIRMLEDNDVSNVITGAPAHKSPYFNLVELQPDGSVCLSKKPGNAILRRQDAPPCYDMNASIYVWNRKTMMAGAAIFNDDTRLYEMPAERSIDIDSELDFELVEFLMKKLFTRS